MTESNEKQFQMRVSEQFLRTIDDWRRKQPDLPSRAEAVRRLVDAGLSQSQPRPAKRAGRKGSRPRQRRVGNSRAAAKPKAQNPQGAGRVPPPSQRPAKTV